MNDSVQTSFGSKYVSSFQMPTDVNPASMTGIQSEKKFEHGDRMGLVGRGDLTTASTTDGMTARIPLRIVYEVGRIGEGLLLPCVCV